MRKILAFTSIRSDYDLMSGLYKLLHQSADVDFRLLVSGAHLSADFGRTVDEVYRDGLPILAEIESLVAGDTASSRVKTAAMLLQLATDPIAQWAPDLMIYAGDREDVLMAATLGTYLRIPTVHFFGGDHEQDGHADTPVRHAVSKLSTAHVVSTEEHRQRLIAMGESANRICVAGSIALDRFVAHKALPAAELKKIFPAGKALDGYALCIFHPVDDESDEAPAQFEAILSQLRARGIAVCASYPNTDPGNQALRAAMARHQGDTDCWFFHNLDRERFLSLYKGARFLIGNSSSGILEAASIPLAAINVGLRQRGRAAGANVVFCDADAASIAAAIDRVQAPQFQAALKGLVNPYGSGDSCARALRFLQDTDFAKLRAKTEDPLKGGAA